MLWYFGIMPHPDVGVLVELGQVEHVVQGQHARGSLGEVHGWVYMVLKKHRENDKRVKQDYTSRPHPVQLLYLNNKSSTYC